MNEDDSAAWHQVELEARRFEEEQALLRADPGYTEFLEFIDRVNRDELKQ